jgi:hypothetical protein
MVRKFRIVRIFRFPFYVHAALARISGGPFQGRRRAIRGFFRFRRLPRGKDAIKVDIIGRCARYNFCKIIDF